MLLVLLLWATSAKGAEEAGTVHARRLLPVVPVVLAAGLVALVVRVQLVSAHSDYRVQEGDTLSQLAERLGVPVRFLAEANGIADPDFIVAGRLLVVPDGPGGGASTEYLVKAGDTLASISTSVGIPVADLARANGLTDANWIPAGRLLTVPPVGGAGSAGPLPGKGGGTYTVREGDNLTAIADRLGVPVDQLAKANGINNRDHIVIGQVISAPNVWLCPVPAGTFSNDYGYVNEAGGKHNGVDLFAARGAPVQAPVGGTVERYPNPMGGNALRLHGNDGNRYYFAHLDGYGEGGEVGAGSVIGYVGNTGDAAQTSPHLHLEIRPGGGAAVNPFPSLVAACR